MSFASGARKERADASRWAASSAGWGTAYVYDGMGNLLQKNVTAGSAPSLARTVNLANNGSLSEGYDFNGNTISTLGIPSMAYDMQNRMVQLYGWNHYAYNASNQRVWRLVNNNGTVTEEFYLYGVNGSRVATYTLQFNPPGSGYAAFATATVKDYSVYFAGRLIAHGEPDLGYDGVYGNGIQAVSTDQVGSAIDDKSLVFGGGDTYQQFYPWGEEKFGSSPNDRVKFATYRRDSESGIDYAWNRYYNNATGRFLTPDPYKGSADPYNPQNWNRYGYGLDDPEGTNDSWALCPPGYVPVTTAKQRQQIISAAESYVGQGLGHPGSSHCLFNSGGTLQGIDCSGLLAQALAGIPFSSTLPFDQPPSKDQFTTSQVPTLFSPDTSGWQVGDIILFPGHAGIVTGVSASGQVTSFVGSQSSTGPADVAITPGSYWAKRLSSARPYIPCVPAEPNPFGEGGASSSHILFFAPGDPVDTPGVWYGFLPGMEPEI